MALAFSYLRMSRPEQIKGDSLRRQLEASREYAIKHGLTLNETMQDIGVSAFRGKNRTEGTLAAFLDLIRDGDIPSGSVLLVENLDRLSREQVSTALALFLSIIDAGVSIVTLSDGQVYSKAEVDRDFTKLLMSIVYMARAHDESAMKSARLVESWKAKRARAQADPKAKLTGCIPGWLTLNKARTEFRVREDRAAIVCRLFEECASGIGSRMSARRLNDENVTPFGRAKGWRNTSIRQILTNEAVIGRFQPGVMKDGVRVPEGPPIEGYFPAIVPEALFFRAQKAMTGRRKGSAGQDRGTCANLFRGLVRCAYCGGPMYYHTSGGLPEGRGWLQCDIARRRVRKDGELVCSHIKTYPYEMLERHVLACLPDIDISQMLDLENQATAALREELGQVEARLASALAKQKRLVAMAEEVEPGDGDEVDDALAGRIAELRSEIRSLRARRKELEGRLQSTEAAVVNGEHELMMAALEHMQRLDEIDDRSERYRARASFAQDLKRFIERIDINEAFADVIPHGGEGIALILDAKAFAGMMEGNQA
ncbi:recombinase family protein [Magnetospirillum sp. LM-5]|uniref:recombinase family protein n=1 Tax=Magnetospirillum sp. LM-5 TaxID=2681466 RepID=UPI0021105D3C|nr:recombinase family protein [Magnetospirillum sp. LM-5]